MNESNAIEKKDNNNHEMTQMAEVASEVQLVSVDLIQFCGRKYKETNGRTMNVSFSTNTASTTDIERNEIAVVVDASMSAKCEDEDSPAVEVRAAIKLVYQCEGVDRFDEEHIDAFGNINGVYNAWPYWREYVQNAVARLGLSPLVVPSHRI